MSEKPPTSEISLIEQLQKGERPDLEVPDEYHRVAEQLLGSSFLREAADYNLRSDDNCLDLARVLLYQPETETESLWREVPVGKRLMSIFQAIEEEMIGRGFNENDIANNTIEIRVRGSEETEEDFEDDDNWHEESYDWLDDDDKYLMILLLEKGGGLNHYQIAELLCLRSGHDNKYDPNNPERFDTDMEIHGTYLLDKATACSRILWKAIRDFYHGELD